jgi:hypothetical protein
LVIFRADFGGRSRREKIGIKATKFGPRAIIFRSMLTDDVDVFADWRAAKQPQSVSRLPLLFDTELYLGRGQVDLQVGGDAWDALVDSVFKAVCAEQDPRTSAQPVRKSTEDSYFQRQVVDRRGRPIDPSFVRYKKWHQAKVVSYCMAAKNAQQQTDRGTSCPPYPNRPNVDARPDRTLTQSS